METRTVVCDDISLRVLDFGGVGDTVILLHGAMSRAANWFDVACWMKDHFRVLAFDQRGHGRSGKPLSGYSRDDFVRDLVGVMDSLSIRRAHLLGHSFGGLNAWVAASRYPERVETLTIEDMGADQWPAETVDQWRSWFDEWPLPFPCLKEARRYFASIRPSFADHFMELLEERDSGYWPVFSFDTVLDVLRGVAAKSWWNELRDIRCPTLLIRGEHSDILKRDEALAMHRALKCGHFVEVSAAHHVIHDDQPERFKEVVLDFLLRTAPRDREAAR